LTVVLDKIEHIPALMTLTRFMQAPAKTPLEHVRSSSSSSSGHGAAPPEYFQPRVSVDALRLIQLSERTSALMKSAVSDELIRTDSLLTLYRTFGDLHDLPVSSSLSIVAQEGFPYAVADHARLHHSDMVVLSWIAPGGPHGSAGQTAGTGPGVSAVLPSTDTDASLLGAAAAGGNPGALQSAHVENPTNPFDALFRTTSVSNDPSTLNTQFVRRVFSESTVDVALYVDRSCLRERGLLGVGKGIHQHILLPFFGGPDDRLALAFVMQLCAHPGISATIVRIRKTEASQVNLGIPTEAQTIDTAGHGSVLAAMLRQQQSLAGAAGNNEPEIVSLLFRFEGVHFVLSHRYFYVAMGRLVRGTNSPIWSPGTYSIIGGRLLSYPIHMICEIRGRLIGLTLFLLWALCVYSDPSFQTPSILEQRRRRGSIPTRLITLRGPGTVRLKNQLLRTSASHSWSAQRRRLSRC
jgi:hypothetical protein